VRIVREAFRAVLDSRVGPDKDPLAVEDVMKLHLLREACDADIVLDLHCDNGKHHIISEFSTFPEFLSLVYRMILPFFTIVPAVLGSAPISRRRAAHVHARPPVAAAVRPGRPAGLGVHRGASWRVRCEFSCVYVPLLLLFCRFLSKGVSFSAGSNQMFSCMCCG
jgi:hypothetical protein